MVCAGQKSKADSLISLLKKSKDDSSKVFNLNELGWEIMYQNTDSSIILSEQALQLAQKLNWKRGIINSNSDLGVYYWLLGNYPVSLNYHFTALQLAEEIKDKAAATVAIGNIGIVYNDQENYTKAIDYFEKALVLETELKNDKGIARNLGNIGTLYLSSENYAKALSYLFRSLEIDERNGWKEDIAADLCNIGNVYNTRADSAFAKGNLVLATELYPKAIDYYFRSLELAKETGAENYIATLMVDIGTLYSQHPELAPKGKDQGLPGETFLQKGIEIGGRINSLTEIRSGYLALSELYQRSGRFDRALDCYQKYIAARDSISNEENTKKQVRYEMNFEFEKKQAVTRMEQEKKDAVSAAEKRKQRLTLVFVCIALVIVTIFTIFIIRSYRQKQKANTAILTQKRIIEAKQKEILDSIYYARRIQRALLPTEKLLRKILDGKT
jgi:tetratricopeptide (TPR) repeat protein